MPERVRIECPDCGCMDTRVIKTRDRRDLKYTFQGKPVVKRVRNRRCRNCGRTFRTSERIGD